MEQSKDKASAPKLGEWQLCPKCNGHGIINNPYAHTVSTPTTIPCDVCQGAKILARPVQSSAPLPEEEYELVSIGEETVKLVIPPHPDESAPLQEQDKETK